MTPSHPEARERVRLIELFVRESNHIEGIDRAPTDGEVAATAHFVALEKLRLDDFVAFVSACQPNAILRDRPGLNVRVGNHIAPAGGRNIIIELEQIIVRANKAPGVYHPWMIHRLYETLHPFTDGNGRSGRALWLWMMLRIGGNHAAMAMQLGFLHTFYYQTLEQPRPALGRTGRSR